MKSVRIVIGVGQGPKEPIDGADGSVAAPSLSNANDPNHQQFVDFVEFTKDENDKLFIDTTLVDQFGFPLQLQISPPDINPDLQQGVGVQASRSLLFGSAGAFTKYLSLVGADGAFNDLAKSEGDGNLAGVSYPYRILSPKDFVQLNHDNSSSPQSNLNSYFDASLIDLYTRYSATGKTLILDVPNPNFGVSPNTLNSNDPQFYTFVGQTKTITTSNHNYTVLEFSDPDKVGGGKLYNDGTQNDARFDVYAPFFQTNGDGTKFPTTAQFPVTLPPFPAFPGGILPGQTEWPSEMVWANDGVFADNLIQFGAPADHTTTDQAHLKSNLLANIENQIVSALSRGIANDDIPVGKTATQHWTDPTTEVYKAGSTANFYAGFWHQANQDGTISSTSLPVSIGHFAYAFPYDDQGNNSSTIVSTNPQAVTITLGAFQLALKGGKPPVGKPPSASSLFVTKLYQQILDRAPEQGGLAVWVSLLDSGSASQQQVAQGILESAEHRGLQVDDFYQRFLHRAAEASGRAFWVQQLLAGASETSVEVGFLSSAEYLAEHPGPDTLVSSFYMDILGRPADAAGMQYWESLAGLPAGPAGVAAGLLDSWENDVDRIDQLYAKYLGRAPESTGLGYWLGRLVSHTESFEQEELVILTSPEAIMQP
jgi:hypothetical protein